MSKTMRISFVICLFIALLCGCSTQSENNTMRLSDSEFVLEKVSGEDVFGVTVSVGRTEAGYYTVMRDREKGTSVHFYNEKFGQIECIELEQIDGYDVRKLSLNKEGGYYAFLAATDAEKSSFIGFIIATYDHYGKVLEKTEITQVVFNELGNKPVFVNAILTGDGKLVLPAVNELGTENLTIVSTQGDILNRIPLVLSEITNSPEVHLIELREEADGTVVLLIRQSEYARENNEYSICKIDLGFDKEIKIICSIDNKKTVKLADAYEKENIYIIGDEYLFEYNLVNDTMNEVFSLNDLGITIYDIQGLFLTSNNEWYLWGVTNKSDNEKNQSSYNWLTVTEQIGHMEIAGTLLVAAVGSENVFDYEIDEFKRTHNNIKIEKKVYANQDHLFADLAAGNYPDLILLNDGIDINALIEKNILADLKPFLGNDPEVSEDDFMKQAVSIYEDDARILAIPRYMVVTAMIGNVDYVGNRETWTFNEFSDFVESLPNHDIVTAGMNRTDILDCVLWQNMEEYVNYDEKKCSFETSSFYDLLSVLSIYPKDSIEVRMSIDAVMSMIEDEQLILMPVSIGDIQEMELYIAEFNGKGHFLGFPTQAGGYGFWPVGVTIAITEKSQNKDIAWELWKMCMTKKDIGQLAFPTLIKAYKEVIEEAKTMGEEDSSSMLIEIGGHSIEVPHLSLEQIEVLNHMIINSDPRQNINSSIRDIILEEAEGFFDGFKTKEEIAKIIQDRVRLYLQE